MLRCHRPTGAGGGSASHGTRAPAEAAEGRPQWQAEPQGAADDLTAISGVGPKLQTALNGAGIFHYWQIAALTDAQIAALDSKLDFRGRIERDGWIEQARKLAKQPAEG